MSDPELVAEIADLVAATMHRSILSGADVWLKLDLTMPQLKILMLLGHGGGASVSWLAARLDVSPPNVTGILDRLELHDWVRRTADLQDRRVVRIVLTEAGEQILHELNQAGAERLAHTVAGMTDAEQVALRDGLRGLVRSIRTQSSLPSVDETHYPAVAPADSG